MIAARKLLHHYSYRRILDGVSFDIKRGELVAVMGPNGTGKSTILRLIAGDLCPLEGSIGIDGKIRRSSERAELEIRQQMVYLPDHPWLPVAASGHEFLAAVGELYSIKPLRILEHIEQLLEVFNLTDQARTAISRYSNGQKKKIAIAAALMTDAELLVLDEPFTGGLDPEGMHALKAILGKFADDEHRTVVIASQIPEIVAQIAHRVLFLKDSKTLVSRSIAELAAETREGANIADTIGKIISPERVVHLETYLGR